MLKIFQYKGFNYQKCGGKFQNKIKHFRYTSNDNTIDKDKLVIDSEQKQKELEEATGKNQYDTTNNEKEHNEHKFETIFENKEQKVISTYFTTTDAATQTRNKMVNTNIIANNNRKHQHSERLINNDVALPNLKIIPEQFSMIKNSLNSNIMKMNDSSTIIDVQQQFETYQKTTLLMNDIPGPKFLKLISQLFNVLPFIGKQLSLVVYKGLYRISAMASLKNDQFKIKPNEYLFKKYGSMVHIPGIFGGHVIILNHPEHIKSIFLQEKHSKRCSSYIDCLEKYNCQRYRTSSSTSLISAIDSRICEGAEYHPQMQIMETPIENLLDKIEISSDELITTISKIKNERDEITINFWNEINRWSLECAGQYLFNRRYGFLNTFTDAVPKTEAIQLYEALKNVSQSIESCEKGLQLWRIYNTPIWIKLVTNMKTIDRITMKYITEAQNNLNLDIATPQKTNQNDNGNLPIIETLLKNEQFNIDKVKQILSDTLILGRNSISSAFAFLLYNLAKNVREQSMVIEELDRLLPSKDTIITYEKLNEMKFLKSCIMESLRLNPPLPYLCRLTEQDIEINKFKIPKGTYIIMANGVTSLNEEHFIDADKFKPYRWLTPGEYQFENSHPFAMLPFGYGRQSCIGRHLAEIQLSIGLAKILKNYTIEYHYGELTSSTNSYISLPTKPLKFKFIDRI